MAVSGLITTIGASNANSYASLAYAEQYFEDRLFAGSWTGASDDDKLRALLQATIRIDFLDYSGERYEYEQRLRWPRVGSEDRDGYIVWDYEAIPPEILRAQCETAIWLLEADQLSDHGLEQFSQVSAGPVSAAVRPRPAGVLPAHIRRMLGHLTGGGLYSQRIVRGA